MLVAVAGTVEVAVTVVVEVDVSVLVVVLKYTSVDMQRSQLLTYVVAEGYTVDVMVCVLVIVVHGDSSCELVTVVVTCAQVSWVQ